MISRLELAIIWRGHRNRIWKCTWFSSIVICFSEESHAGTKMYPSDFFKNRYPTDYILGYNTLKIETNNENGIKMCQMHENLRKSVL